MGSTPLWFGPVERSRFGWLHLPESGRVQGAVVLCPPLGIEAICTYFTYRTLADRISEHGVAVLRFDYDGTGDSVGEQADADRVAGWRASVDDAIGVLVELGIETIGLGGIRMGALLAADAASRHGGVHTLLLWDPCLSGQIFLREQMAFRMLSLGGERVDDGTVEAPGVLFDAQTVRDLGTIALGKLTRPLAERVLLLEDADRSPSVRLAKAVADLPVERADAIDQPLLLDPPRQETPWITVRTVTDWVVSSFADRETVAVLSPPVRGEAVVAHTPEGAPIRETTVGLGPLDLFGIVTEVSDARLQAPAIVFINEGNTPHIGQSRMWVELARAGAAAGLRCVRVDLSGIGDSSVRPGQEPHVTRALEAFDDIRDIARSVSPGDPRNIVLVGLCSGAYQALEAALDLRLRGISMLNPILTFTPPEQPSDPRRRARQVTRPWLVRALRKPVTATAQRRCPDDPQRWIRSFEIANWPAAIARRQPRVPGFVWVVVRRAFLKFPSSQVLKQAVQRGVNVQMVCGPEDLMPIMLGSQTLMRKISDGPLFHLTVLEGLDHAGLVVEQRRAVMTAVLDHIVGRFGDQDCFAATPGERP